MAGGRPKKPTALHILNGNPSKIPNLGANEPKPVPIAPAPPDWLCPDARVEWDRIAPQLESLGLLTQVDMAALVAYCESWAQYKRAITHIHKHGETFDLLDDDGNVKYVQQSPQVSIANKALANIKSFCTEFGMTPSSRSRMTVPGQDEPQDEMERLLSRGV